MSFALCQYRYMNSLPNDVVHVVSTNAFKSRLDKFRFNQEIIYKELEF